MCMSTQTQFSFTDLGTIKNIIDIASTRGAFRANELTQVGEVYDRLVAFLDQATAAQAQAAAQDQGEQVNTDQETPEGDSNVVS